MRSLVRSRWLVAVGGAGSLCSLGCAARATEPAVRAPAPGTTRTADSNANSGPREGLGARVDSGSAGPPSTSSARSSSAPSASSNSVFPGDAAHRPRAPELVLDPRQPLRPLPELKLENLGLHVGGGPNDAETKAPFLQAIAERFPAFMDCYRLSEHPETGGRFGIDLHIPRAGGHARSSQPRTAMSGADFRRCVGRVFESVDFLKPVHGPTTISYSLNFTFAGAR